MVASLAQAQQIIDRKDQHIAELTSKLTSAQHQLRILQNQVEQLLRRIYGRRSEKLDPNQLMFDNLILEAEEQPEQATEQPSVENPDPPPRRRMKTRRNHPGRIPIPDHLERVEIILDIPEEEKICPETSRPLKLIGWEISEKLEYRPGKLLVNVYKRPKYASPDAIAAEQVGIVTAPMPDHPILKCKADVGLLSHIIVSKFADHLPLYRQDSIFEREGVTIPRATQTSWILQTYEAIRPLGEVLKQEILKTDILFTDDSIIPLLVKGNGQAKKARLWVYVRGGPGPPLTVFDFSTDRSKKRPLEFLDGYAGYIHADAYGGYDELFRKDDVIEVGCWVHARRKFDESISSRPKGATEIMASIARLYQVETACREKEAPERFRMRQEKSKPILDSIFDRVEQLRSTTIPKEPLRKAIDYTLNQRDALMRYLEDGRLKPDNPACGGTENAIRPLALGRKN